MPHRTFNRVVALVLLSGSLVFGPCADAKGHSGSSSKSYGYGKSFSGHKAVIPTEKRSVPSSLKNRVYNESGIPKSERKNYVIDHKVPLELGGSNARSNLQAEPKAEAKVKDRWENYLAGQVKAGRMTLEQAQAEIQKAHLGPPLRN